jgi:hypothetical protein
MDLRAPILAALSLLAAGCLEDLPDPSLLDGLRVLAVRADRPEVGAPETVKLEALVVDTEGRPVELRWYACTLPERGRGLFGGGPATGSSGGSGYGLDEAGSCADATLVTSGLSEFVGAGLTAEVEIPEDFLSDANLYAAYGLADDTELPALVKSGFLQIAGINQTVTLVAQAGSHTLETTKRVNVSTATEPNENPSNIAFDIRPEAAAEAAADALPDTGEPAVPGGCFTSLPQAAKGTYRVTPLNIPSPPPVYQVIVAGTTAEQPFDLVYNDETLFYSLFSAQGRFNTDVAKSTQSTPIRWTLDQDATAPVDLYIVTRDGRGGTTWCKDTLPPP